MSTRREYEFINENDFNWGWFLLSVVVLHAVWKERSGTHLITEVFVQGGGFHKRREGKLAKRGRGGGRP